MGEQRGQLSPPTIGRLVQIQEGCKNWASANVMIFFLVFFTLFWAKLGHLRSANVMRHLGICKRDDLFFGLHLGKIWASANVMTFFFVFTLFCASANAMTFFSGKIELA